MVLRFGLLHWPLWWINWFAVGTILQNSSLSLSTNSMSISRLPINLCLLCLLGVMILLEVLLCHLPLYDHQAGVDKRLLEQLALKHSNQIFDANVLARRSLYDSTVRLDLLLLGQSLLRIGLALLLEGCLVLLKQFCRFFQSILRVLAVNAFIVELSRRSFYLRKYLQHVVCRKLPSSDEGEQKGPMWCQSSVETELHHQGLGV